MNSNIGTNVGGDFSPQGSGVTTGGTKSAAPPAAVSSLGIAGLESSLSKADEKVLLDMLMASGMLGAQAPLLFPPHDGNGSSTSSISGISISAVIYLSYTNVAQNVLDRWSEDVKKNAERSKEIEEEERKNPKNLAALETHSPTYRAYVAHTELVEGFPSAVNEALKVAAGSPGNTDDPYRGLVGVATVMAGVNLTGVDTLVGPVVTIDPSLLSTQIAITPSIDRIDRPDLILGFNPNQQAITEMVINFFAVPLMNLAVIEATETAMKDGKKPTDKEAVANFAKNMMQAVGEEGSLYNYILEIFTAKMEIAGPVTAQQKKDYPTQVKILLLGLALAALYKFEVSPDVRQGFTSQELGDLLSGKMKAPGGEVGANLVKVINRYLSQLPPETRETIIGSLLAYVDDKQPTLKDLMTPQKAVDGMFSNIPNVVETAA